MRRASFAITPRQMLARTKTHTRRLGWTWAKPGMRLRAMVKTRGVRVGDERDLGIIEIVEVRREPLNAITQADVIAEGFPEWTPDDFVRMFVEANRCAPDVEVTVVVFRHIVQRPEHWHEAAEGVEIWQGDARELLPLIIGRCDRRRIVVLTDPPWPGAKGVDIEGSENAVELWREVAAIVPLVADRLVVQIGALTDPRDMLDAVPRSMPFFGQVGLRYFPPIFRDVSTVDRDLAYTFGHTREHLADGQKVFRAFCEVNEVGDSRVERMKLTHPCPRNREHVRWLVRHYCAQADLVVDPFCGSGTTLVACAELGIPCVGIDVDQRWIAESSARVARSTAQGRLVFELQNDPLQRELADAMRDTLHPDVSFADWPDTRVRRRGRKPPERTMR